MPLVSFRSRVLILWTILAGAGACLLHAAAAYPLLAREEVTEPGWRGPAALWLAPDNETLFVACSKSGTLQVIDVGTRTVLDEIPLGKSLVSLAGTPDSRKLVIVDAGANEAIIVHRDGRSIKVQSRVALPTQPVHAVMGPTGNECYVTSRWSRVVSRVQLDSGTVHGTISLNFSPRSALLLADGRMLVAADAFGGFLALIDTSTNELLRQVHIPGHNMRGLALSPNGMQLLVTHMIVTESASTTRDNVFWGIVMTSNLRVIPIQALLNSEKNPVREAHTHFFGDPGNASGDPDSLAILPDGTTIVCMAGVDEVAIGRYTPYAFRRIPVGQRPTALAVSADQKHVFVANTGSDTISLLDIANRAVEATIRLGPQKLTLAEEGEQLFYDAKLSLDGWFSCHSCHTDGHTNGQRADTFGDGSYGAPKTVLSLLGTADTEPWAWNGSQKLLEDQIRQSLRLTMQGKTAFSERTVAALTSYLRDLEPPPVTQWQQANSAEVARGAKIFASRGCVNCHAPPIYSNMHNYDVGLHDGEGGNRHFNPPSLRGLAHNAPYFHDGRAKSLVDVVTTYQHRLRTALSEDEVRDLVAFLKSL